MSDTFGKVLREDLLRVRKAFPPEAASRFWSRATHCVVTFVDADGDETLVVLSQRTDYPGDDMLGVLFPEAIIRTALWENLFDYGRELLPRSVAVGVAFMKEVRLTFFDEQGDAIGEFSVRPSEVIEF